MRRLISAATRPVRAHGGLRALMVLTVLMALQVLSLGTTQAGTISLEWDPVTHEGLVGYRVYRGTASGVYSIQIDTGLTPRATLGGLADCTTYFVAVKARAEDGSESPVFSNEISGWARPELESVTPASVEASGARQLTVDGTNFQPGATVEFSDPAIAVTNVTVVDCTRLLVDVTIDAGASLGSVNLDVINPDQVFGTGNGLLTLTDPTDLDPPVLSAVTARFIGSTTATVTWATDEPADSQVFFRVAGRQEFQSAPLDAALVSDHSVALTGLMPATDYEFYVASADSSGNQGTSAQSSFRTEANGFTYLDFEAEAAQIAAPLETGTDAAAFQGGWLGLEAGAPTGTPGSPSGVASYGFAVPSAGTWHVWLRLYAQDGDSDSWLERVDAVNFNPVIANETGAWHWVLARGHSLTVGQHTLDIGGREPGSRVDRILITDDPDFVPSEQPESDVTAPARPGDVTATAAQTTIALGWSQPTTADVERLVVRYRTDGVFPTSPVDGGALVDDPGQPGAAGSFTHEGLANGQTVHYSVFAIDAAGNVSEAATVSATTAAPSPPRVPGLRRTDRR